MHELSIAMSIVEIACEEAGRQGGGPVDEVHLKMGLDSGVVSDALLFSWELACEGTRAEGAKLLIDQQPGRDLQVSAIVVLVDNDAAPH
jgi:hydrogenase nickel incorporation protein HypA/HybF